MDSSRLFELTLSVHSLLRGVLVVAGAWVFVQACVGMFKGTELGALGKRMQLGFMINVDLQVLFGILLWTMSPTVTQARGDMAASMKDPEARYFLIEHGMTMVLLLIVVHVGRMTAKRASELSRQHKRTAIYAGLALLLIALRTPWPFTSVARPLLRMLF